MTAVKWDMRDASRGDRTPAPIEYRRTQNENKTPGCKTNRRPFANNGGRPDAPRFEYLSPQGT
jgi:hypothetical protein